MYKGASVNAVHLPFTNAGSSVDVAAVGGESRGVYDHVAHLTFMQFAARHSPAGSLKEHHVFLSLLLSDVRW